MDPNQILQSELHNLIGGLHDQISEGFKGVNERLDDLNGRTRKNEIAINTLEVKAATEDKVTTKRLSFWAIIVTVGQLVLQFVLGKV